MPEISIEAESLNIPPITLNRNKNRRGRISVFDFFESKNFLRINTQINDH